MMPKPVTRRVQAQRDVEQAADCYFDEGGVPLEVRFLEAVESAVRHIAAYPTTGSRRYAGAVRTLGLRFWQLKRFPYLIFYVERAEQIDVWRVFHDHRDLPAWLRESSD